MAGRSTARRIPATVVGGYLGAGKTTLVNRLLREAGGLRLAVLVNEFGDISIDADLIEGVEGGVISIAGGCICCSYGSDLMAALIEIGERTPRPDHVLIETSGVALPGAVAQSLSLTAALALDAVVVMADVETLAARARDRYMGDTIARQLAEADLIILNKTDLVAPEQLCETRLWIAAQWPAAAVIPAVRAEVARDVVLGIGAAGTALPPLRLSEHAASQFASSAFDLDGPSDARRLGEALAGGIEGLIRAKGFVAGAGGGIETLQVVGRRFEATPAPAGVTLRGRYGHLVCIGLRGSLDRAGLAAALRAARIE